MQIETQKALYLPGVNGIRALAAIGVVLSHISGALKDFGLKSTLFGTNLDGSPKVYLLASYGVCMFFVLSGFLITYLLQLESGSQEINIKKFY
jgi:peptidoglycan/LPS O-acetylase OafA/YrhL